MSKKVAIAVVVVVVVIAIAVIGLVFLRGERTK